MHREEIEFQAEFLRGKGIRRFYQTGFKQLVDDIKKELLTNQNLEDGRRIGYVVTLQKIKEGFVNAFENANVTPPDWLEVEII